MGIAQIGDCVSSDTLWSARYAKRAATRFSRRVTYALTA